MIKQLLTHLAAVSTVSRAYREKPSLEQCLLFHFEFSTCARIRIHGQWVEDKFVFLDRGCIQVFPVRTRNTIKLVCHFILDYHWSHLLSQYIGSS